MAKVTFHYDTDENRVELMRTMKALDMALALDDLYNKIRAKLKYDDSISDQEYEFWEKARELLTEIVDEHNIKLYELLE